MAIKAVSKERIDEAMLEFDRKYRSRREWLGWENNQAHRYAVHEGGELYPAKKIVSLATGIAVGEFSGGHPTNSYLEKRGFTVVELPRGASEPVLQFTPGAVYDRKTEINGPFGGSLQSGIAASATYPVIFLFTGDSGEQFGYADHWEDGAYLYTGEGQRGPMTLIRGNRAIAEHAENGRALHLFKSLGKGKGNAYVGEFSCADRFERIQPDVSGQDRTAIVFRLVPVGIPGEIIEAEELDEDVERDIFTTSRQSVGERPPASARELNANSISSEACPGRWRGDLGNCGEGELQHKCTMKELKDSWPLSMSSPESLS